MPPLRASSIRKSTVDLATENVVPKTMATRTSRVLSSAALKKENKSLGPLSKRKAVSPMKGNTLKRSALGNITNAIEKQCVITSGKKSIKKPMTLGSAVTKPTSTVTKPTISTTAKISLPASNTLKPSGTNVIKKSTSPGKAMLPPLPKSRLVVPIHKPKPSISGNTLRTVASTKVGPVAQPIVTKQSPSAGAKRPPPKVTAKPRSMVSSVPNTRRSSGRRSTLDSDGSLYMSALSEVLDDESERLSTTPVEKPEPLPKPLVNIDEEYINDPHQCALYAHDIFEYLKSREEHFKIDDYMDKQPGLGTHVRAIVVDWMVEIQENFELNHETLYLGVKLLDSYLSKVKVAKPSLQLIGATAMFIASKYDERMPPAIEDFIVIADGAYRRRDVIKMELNILRVVNYELGFPLSYRFLRRYARCAKTPMPLLTLARFILELTLMDYPTILLSDSKTAAAALYLAFKMKKEQEWDDTLVHFSGYRVKDFIDIVHHLNNCLHQKQRLSLSTVRNKYSHQIFYEVAKVPLVNTEDL